MNSPSHTTPTGRLAPYAGMTDEELDDFETWAREVEQEYSGALIIALVLAGIVLAGIVLWSLVG